MVLRLFYSGTSPCVIPRFLDMYLSSESQFVLLNSIIAHNIFDCFIVIKWVVFFVIVVVPPRRGRFPKPHYSTRIKQ